VSGTGSPSQSLTLRAGSLGRPTLQPVKTSVQTTISWFGMKFLTVIVTGLSLIAPAAHLFELPNKIGMPQAEYFVVQQIYSGWWIVGLLLPLAFIANAGNAISLRADRTAMMLSIAAAARAGKGLGIHGAAAKRRAHINAATTRRRPFIRVIWPVDPNNGGRPK
jgi:hypothetical protein